MKNIIITPQKIVLFFLGILLLTVAFPPWEFVYATPYGKSYQPAGLSFILSPPALTETNALVSVSIDFSRLLVSILTIVAAFVFSSVLHGHISAKNMINSYVKQHTSPSLENVAAMVESGLYDDAIKMCDDILESDPKNAAAYFGLGVCFLMKNDAILGEKYIAKAAGLGDPLAREYLMKK